MRQPPSSLTAPLQQYLSDVAAALNALPTFSNFTGTDPNGRVLGKRFDQAGALDTSTSTTSLFWINMNPIGVVSTQSWVQVVVV